MLNELRQTTRKLQDEAKAKILQRFFKTGPGEYAAGDVFLGIKVPESRKLAKQFRHLSLTEITELIKSKYHEERLIALFILTHQYNSSDTKQRNKIYRTYCKHMPYINNWDLVDGSAPYIPGPHLFEKKDYKILSRWAASKQLWTRRIAILTTFYFIRNNEFQETLTISEKLLSDKHDLIHKAVGWMLREIGKRDIRIEESFLIQHYQGMPRTMLRYAIEKFPEKKRKAYLAGAV